VKVDQYQQLVKRWRNIFIAAVLSLVGVVFWHFYRSTLQKRQLRIRTLEGIQEDRLRIGRSLHDDLGNRLSEIQLLAEQVKNASGIEFTTLAMVDRIHGRSVQAVESLDKMVWLLRDVSESAEDVAKHLELLAKNHLDVCTVGLDFKMLSGHEHEISGWVRQLLIAATQELTRNAVKHGRATDLEMRLRVSDDSVSFRVEDNGCGFDLQTALLSGRGLSSILKRCKDFGGTTSVVSRPGSSVILIQLPRLVV
jgi:signal transduction histidine kinase